MKTVEEICETIFHTSTISKREVSLFFGCEQELITEKDLNVVRSIFKIIGCELIEAARLSPLVKCKNLEDSMGCEENFLLDQQRQFPYHDIAHSFVSFEKEKTLRPLFLKSIIKFNNESVLREEMHALLWLNQFGDYPTFVTFMFPQLIEKWIFALKVAETKAKEQDVPEEFLYVEQAIKIAKNVDPNSFDSIFNSYQEFVIEVFRRTTIQTIYSEKQEHKKDQIMKEFEEISKRMMLNPDELFKNRARRIFKHYGDNHKFLLDEFFKLTDSLAKA